MDWLSHVFSMYNGEQRRAIEMLCWAIWRCRNELIWRQKGADILVVVLVSKSVLHQWELAQDKSFNLSMSLVDANDGAETFGLLRMSIGL